MLSGRSPSRLDGTSGAASLRSRISTIGHSRVNVAIYAKGGTSQIGSEDLIQRN